MNNRRLDPQLLNAMSNPLANQNQLLANLDYSKRWLCRLIEVNQGMNGLGELLEHLIRLHEKQAPNAQLGLETILLQCVLFDPAHREQSLDAVWQYLIHQPESRLSNLIQLKDTLYPTTEIDHSSKTPSSLLLLNALTEIGNNTSCFYVNDFYDVVVKEYSEDHIDTLTAFKRLHPDYMPTLCTYFTRHKLLNQSSFTPESQAERRFISLLFSDSRNLLAKHFSFSFEHALNALFTCNYKMPFRESWLHAKRMLDEALVNLNCNIDESNSAELISLVSEQLRRFHYKASGNESTIKQKKMGELFFSHFVSGMDRQLPSWRTGLAYAMSNNQTQFTSAVSTDDIHAAGLVLSGRNSTPLMKVLACTALKGKPPASIVDAFSDMPEAMAELYRHTREKSLLSLMSPSAKRMILGDDLSL